MQKFSVRVLVHTVIAIAAMAVCGNLFAQAEPLHGVVTNQTDKGIKDVLVVLRAPGSDEPIEEHTTDKDGKFSLAMDSLRPGQELYLQKDGYDDVTLTISPQQLVVTNIRVIMKPSVVEAPPRPAAPRPTPPPSLVSREQREKAVELYNKAVEQWEEDDPEIKKEALHNFRESASLDPTFAEPVRMLSRLALEQKNWAEASRYAEDLIRIDPTDLEAVRTLYFSMVIIRHHLRIGEAARRLAQIDPGAVVHIDEHAQAFFTNEQYVMARAMYEILTTISPDPATAYLNLGVCCANLGDVEGTRTAFERFLELAPEDHPDLESVKQDLAALDAPVIPESSDAPEAPE